MPVSAKDYVESAEELVAGSSEIDWRNAISRAYYGAFNWAREHVDPFCSPLPYHVQPAGSHEKVILRYEHHDRGPARAIAYVLHDMKRKRKIADYSLGSNVPHIDAKVAVQSGRQAIQRISKLTGAQCPYDVEQDVTVSNSC